MFIPEPGAARTAYPGVTVTPAGCPDTVSVTAELNPPDTVTVSCTAPDPPGATFNVGALNESVKLPAGVTVRVRDAFCVTPPPVAVTVTG